MPTLRERMNELLEGGVELEAIRTKMADMGVEQSDLDLDVMEAKRVGAGRLVERRAQHGEPMAQAAVGMGAVRERPGQPEPVEQQRGRAIRSAAKAALRGHLGPLSSMLPDTMPADDVVAKVQPATLVGGKLASIGQDVATALKGPLEATERAAKMMGLPSMVGPMRELAKARAMGPSQEVGLPEDVSSIESAGPAGETLAVDPVERARGFVRGVGGGLVDVAVHPIDTVGKAMESVAEEQRRRVAGQSVGSRVLSDLGDLAMGVPKMVAMAVEPLPKGVDQGRYAEQMGGELVKGAAGAVAQTIRHPLESLEANPITTAMDLIPGLGAAGKLVKSASPTRWAKAAAKVTEVAKPVTDLMGRAAESDVATKARQILVDERAQSTPYRSGVAEEGLAAGQHDVARRIVDQELDPAFRAQQPEGRPVVTVEAGRVGPVERQVQSIAREPAAIGTNETARRAAERIGELTGVKEVAEIERELLRHYGEHPTDAPPVVRRAGMETEVKVEPTGKDVAQQQRLAREQLERQAGAEAVVKIGETDAPSTTKMGEWSGVNKPSASQLPLFREQIEPVAQQLYRRFVETGELPATIPAMLERQDLVSAMVKMPDRMYERGQYVGLMRGLRERFAEMFQDPGTKVDRAKLNELIEHLDRMERHGDAIVDPKIAELWRRVEKQPEVTGFLRGIQQMANWIKGSLTVQNPASTLNNFVSNFALQTARTGNPASVATRLMGTAWQLKAKPGTVGALSDLDTRAMRYWNESGMLNSTQLGNDVAKMADMGLGYVARGGPVGKAMEWAYGAGDNIFKADEALQSLRHYRGLAGRLKAGEYLDLEISPNVTARVTGGSDVATLRAGDRVLREIPAEQAMWRAGARQAQNLFFDYGEVPAWVRWMRSVPGVSVVSPFVTWSAKAMDLPGKKGLLYRTMESPQGIAGTNSASVLRWSAANDLKVAAQRAASVGALREALKDESNQQVREAVSFAPTQAKLALVRELADPSIVAVEQMGNWNWLQPTERALRVLMQAAGKAGEAWDGADKVRQLQLEQQVARDPAAFDAVTNQHAATLRSEQPGTPEYQDSWRQYQERNRARSTVDGMDGKQRADLVRAAEWSARLNGPGYATLEDALSLVSVSGNPVIDVWLQARENSRLGKTTDWAKVAMTSLIPMAIGGLGRNAVDLAAAQMAQSGLPFVDDAARPEAMPWTSMGLDDPEQVREDDYLRFAIRRMTGVGWRAMMRDERVTGRDIRSFVSKVRDEWEGSLGVSGQRDRQIKDAMAAYEKQAQSKDPKVAEPAKKAMELLEQQRLDIEHVRGIVGEEIDQFGRMVDDAIKLTTQTKLPQRAKE